MEFLSVVTKEQSYSLPHSTTFPKQQKSSLCFWPICKSRNCLLSKTLPHTHCRVGSFIDFLCASFGAAPVPVEAGSVEETVPPVEVEATAVCDLIVICDAAVAMVVVVVVVTVIDVSPVVTVSAAVTVSDVLVSVADFLGEGSQPF